MESAGTPTPSGTPSNSWRKGPWIVASLLSVILPFYKNKLTSLFSLKKEVDTIMDRAEIVLDVVEKVAGEVAEITDDLGDKLPEGGKLKEAFNLVENVAKEIVKDANIAEELLDKVEKVEKEVESLLCEVNKDKVAGDHTIPMEKMEQLVPRAKL